VSSLWPGEKVLRTRDRGSGETAKAVITVNSTEAAPVERFFLPFTKRSRVPNRDGRGDFFFRRAPICRCRDAGKKKICRGNENLGRSKVSEPRVID
jgi:hypothetical protein